MLQSLNFDSLLPIILMVIFAWLFLVWLTSVMWHKGQKYVYPEVKVTSDLGLDLRHVGSKQ